MLYNDFGDPMILYNCLAHIEYLDPRLIDNDDILENDSNDDNLDKVVDKTSPATCPVAVQVAIQGWVRTGLGCAQGCIRACTVVQCPRS